MSKWHGQSKRRQQNVKYIGSKAKIANDIVPIIQRYIDEHNIKQYIEPFVGGFNIIDKIKCEYRLGNDIDPLVCELVEACRENPALLDKLNTPSRAEYYDVRDNPDKYPCWYRAAAVTKDGKTRNYFNEARENFRRQLPALRNILVGCCDYRELRLPERERVLVYCDPPYSDGIGYGGGKFDTAQFWEWCRTQTAAGHIVIVSEYTAPDDFVCIWQHEITTHLNNRNKQNRIEKLFIHGGAQWHKYTT